MSRLKAYLAAAFYAILAAAGVVVLISGNPDNPLILIVVTAFYAICAPVAATAREVEA